MATKKQTNIFQSVMPRTQTQKVVKEKASEYILVKSETLSDGTVSKLFYLTLPIKYLILFKIYNRFHSKY